MNIFQQKKNFSHKMLPKSLRRIQTLKKIIRFFKQKYILNYYYKSPKKKNPPRKQTHS